MQNINTFNQAKFHRRFFKSVIMQAFLEKTFETGLLLQQKKLLIEQDHHPECFGTVLSTWDPSRSSW